MTDGASSPMATRKSWVFTTMDDELSELPTSPVSIIIELITESTHTERDEIRHMKNHISTRDVSW